MCICKSWNAMKQFKLISFYSFILGESCSAMCSVSSLLFNCDFECGSVSSECSGPEDSIEEQNQIIAEAEEEIDAENEKRNDAESFSKMMDFIDQKLEEADVRKTPNDIKKCEDFENRYIEFLDLMVDLADENILELREKKRLILDAAIFLGNICSKSQKDQIKIKIKTKKGKAKDKITIYIKAKDTNIDDLIQVIIDALKEIEEANDELAGQGKPTIAPPTPDALTTTESSVGLETTTSGSSAGLQTATTGSSAGLQTTATSAASSDSPTTISSESGSTTSGSSSPSSSDSSTQTSSVTESTSTASVTTSTSTAPSTTTSQDETTT